MGVGLGSWSCACGSGCGLDPGWVLWSLGEARTWGGAWPSGPGPSPADAPHFPCSVAEEADRHPERRMRAAFTAFEEAQLPRLKQENPNMRLSQLKQLLKKEWLRSPENPMNQRAVPFNAPK